MIWLCARCSVFVVATLMSVAVASPVAAASDQPTVVISQGQGRLFHIAIQRFSDSAVPLSTERSETLRAAVEAGLRFSGLVKPLSHDAFLGSDATERMHDSERSDCADWVQGGADAVVEGRLRLREPGRIEVEFAVWDTARCLRVQRQRLSRSVAALERLGKRLADEVLAAFTGRRGAAASEIAFVSTRTGEREIFVMDADGSHVRPATSGHSVKAFPDWLPGGDGVLYTAYVSGVQAGLYVSSRGKARAGRILGRLFDGWPIYRGVFGPGGDVLALVSTVEENTDIYTVQRNGRGLRKLTRAASIDVSPSWSPDGSQLAFVSDRSGSPQIYLMNRDGSELRRLTYQGGYNTSPAWSPDGRWIAYEARLESQFDIWLIDPTGEVNFPLVVHARSDESPSWSPDSRKLVFSSTRRGRSDLYLVDFTGENLRQLTRGAGDNLHPTWGPHLP